MKVIVTHLTLLTALVDLKQELCSFDECLREKQGNTGEDVKNSTSGNVL